ncbi:MAG: hypothetical protein EA424_29225 [Planctomycetaceae bacterium]|nr:MAG: hypothetical protein EA424_29225 [Planctomycetaceae bacterium]
MQRSVRRPCGARVACLSGVIGLLILVANATAKNVRPAFSIDPPSLLPAAVPGEDEESLSDGDPAWESWGEKEWFSTFDSPGQHWVSGEYLAWWIPGAHAPPLITSSTAVGLLGDVNSNQTIVLFGGGPIQREAYNGFRLRMGSWWDCERSRGWEASFFMVRPGSQSARAGSGDGSAIVGRPFIDANTGDPESQLVSDEGLGGFVDVRTNSTLLGAEILYRHNLFRHGDCCYDSFSKDAGVKVSLQHKRRLGTRLDFLAGFRYLNYSDSVTIREELLAINRPPIPPGTEFDVFDSFRAYNHFYGLTLGVDYSGQSGRWSFAARPQLSVGVVERRVSIWGETMVAVPIPNQPVNQYVGGLLALDSNIGDYRSSQLTVVPELDLQIGYLIHPRWRLLMGYSCLVFPGLARAGEQIDPVVNPNLLPPVTDSGPGPARPAYLAGQSDVWMHGVTAGIEYRW